MGIDIYGDRFKAILEFDYAEALELDEIYEENLLFLSSPEMADCWKGHTETLKTQIFQRAQTEAIKINEAYGNSARFDYLNANGYAQHQLVASAHTEALNEAQNTANTDITSPLRIIADYILNPA